MEFADLASEQLSDVNRDLALDFECGDEEWAKDLRGFLRDNALIDQSQNLGKTYLFLRTSQGEHRCTGFVTLLASEVRKRDWSPIKLLRPEKVRYDAIPAILIGRFAVSVEEQGSGLGAEIMAWVRVVATDLDVGARVLAVHVDKGNERAISFYHREGFHDARVSGGRHQQLMLADLLSEENP